MKRNYNDVDFKQRYDFKTCYCFKNTHAQNLFIKYFEKIKKGSRR